MRSSVPEAAIIAGLLKAPSRLSPATRPEAAASRAILVLAAMRDAGFIDDAGYAAALQQPVTYAANDTGRAETGLEYAVDYVLERLPPLVGHGHTGIVIETTIDAALQQHAQAAVAHRLATTAGTTDDTQAGVVVLDRDGGVRALVGGRTWSRSQFNRAVRARRQPGSAFKPVVYLGALEGGATPDTMVHDRPITIGGWSPRNNRDTYAGAMTLRHALAHSVNTVAVALQQDVGTRRVAAMARRLGITSTLREDASLALGTSEVTLIELTGAYGVLANGGLSLTPHVIRRVRTDGGRRSPCPAGLAPGRGRRARARRGHERHAARRAHHRQRPPRRIRRAIPPAARPAPRRTTATPGSSATPRTSRRVCGPATTTARP